MKRVAWVLMLVGSWVIAGEPTQADIERLLPGKWRVAETAEGASMEVITTYGKDRSYTLAGVIKTASRDLTFGASGSWEVSGNQVKISITKSSHPDVIPVGLVGKDTYLAIDDKSITYKDENGDMATETRVAD